MHCILHLASILLSLAADSYHTRSLFARGSIRNPFSFSKRRTRGSVKSSRLLYSYLNRLKTCRSSNNMSYHQVNITVLSVRSCSVVVHDRRLPRRQRIPRSGGGTFGRHTGLRIQRPQGYEGSIPSSSSSHLRTLTWHRASIQNRWSVGSNPTVGMYPW